MNLKKENKEKKIENKDFDLMIKNNKKFKLIHI